MSGYHLRSVLLIASFAASASTAWAEVPLANMTTQQVRDAVSKELTPEVQAQYAPKPDGLVYTSSGGKQSLVWNYTAAQDLSNEQREKLKSMLIEACVQRKDANGHSLLTDEDGQKLLAALSFKLVPIATSTPIIPSNPIKDPSPTEGPKPISIPKIADVTVYAGSPRVVSFQVLNADASPDSVSVTAVSSDPRLITPADLKLEGIGVDRTLKINSTPGMGGKATITVTASRVGGQSFTASFGVSLLTMTNNSPAAISVPLANSVAPIIPGPTLNYPVMTYRTETYSAMSTACSPVIHGGHCCLFRKKCGGRMSVYSTPAPCGEMGPTYPAMPMTTGQPIYYAPAASDSPSMPMATGQVVYYAPAENHHAFPSTVETVFRPIISRGVLLQGKTAGDWETLFHDGYRAFRSGDYARAVEYFAAAADLNDDPRAWDFLAMASIMTRDPKTARAAAQYSAARVFTKPAIAKASAMALIDVPGTIRDRLMEYKSEVNQARSARSILAARPKLRAESTELAGKSRSESTGIAVTGR